jgi:hypothetical protein
VSRGSRSGGAGAVALALVGLVAHAVVSVMLLFTLVGAAYRFADSIPGAGDVSSFDQLYKVGPSPGVAIACLVLVGLADLLLVIPVAAHPATRRRAWIVPVAGVAVSILVVVFAILAFQPPPPDLGG